MFDPSFEAKFSDSEVRLAMEKYLYDDAHEPLLSSWELWPDGGDALERDAAPAFGYDEDFGDFLYNWTDACNGPQCEDGSSAASDPLDDPNNYDKTSTDQNYESVETRMSQTVGQKRSRGPISLFRLCLSLSVDDVIEVLRDAILFRDQDIESKWPKVVPAEKYFLGEDKLGGLDFGGTKAGTPWLSSENPELGIIINYCERKGDKLEKLFPDQPDLRILKIRLFIKSESKEHDTEWKKEQIKGGTEVYIFQQFAMYVFGGELFELDSERKLIISEERCNDRPNNSLIYLGPSTKRPKKQL